MPIISDSTNAPNIIRNLFHPKTKFFQSKNDKGEWIEPFDPYQYGGNGGHPFTEGNAWQYFWYVPHNIQALMELTGGTKAFEQKLEILFYLLPIRVSR